MLKAGKHKPLTRFLLKLFCEDFYKVLREQQQFLSQRKSQIKDEIARKKEQYMHQFACFFHKTSLDEKQMNKILKMLPDNPKIQALFEKICLFPVNSPAKQTIGATNARLVRREPRRKGRFI